MPSYYEWTSIKREKFVVSQCSRIEVNSHPLKKHSTSKTFMESLNKWSSAFEEVDPLLRFEQMGLDEDVSPEETPMLVNYSKAWNLRRGTILNKYITGEKLTIISSFLPGGEKPLIRQVSNLNEKVKHRLEQLDEFEEGSIRKTMGLSQQEYVTKINLLSDEIKKAWSSEQRVKAFKIGIQCSKLLSDVTAMQFYPSKFVLITDILDTFGNLVFDRLKGKSFGDKELRSIQDIDTMSVSDTAKETCQNWMFKMASIRELLPRLYMEMALLQCYVFISKEEIKPAIARLTKMIRGVGNPLVAVYLRVYLCRVSSKLLGKDSEVFFHINLKEFLEDYGQIFHPTMTKKYEVQLLTLDKYLNLYVPAIDWLLYGTLNSNVCKLTLLEDFLKQCQQIQHNDLLLCCIVSAFDSVNVITKSSEILEMICESEEKMVLLNEVLTSLGQHLCSADNYRNSSSEALIQTWWKIAIGIKSPSHFLQVLEPWIQFACMHLSVGKTQHVNVILRGTIRYMIKCRRPADEFSGNFQCVIKRMLKFIPDVEELFLMDAFMPLVELVQTGNARTMMAKTVLSLFFERCQRAHIDDHVLIASVMRLCCILHDSITAVTVEDESKLCGELITRFVQAVTFPDDAEQQLNFYVESRAAFIKLDSVLIALVHAVNTLSVRAPSRWLQRACAAYCLVTVPSLRAALQRATLYLLGGQVALLNNCIGQAEANFKSLVSLIPNIPDFILEDGQKKPTHVKVEALLSDFLSTLLVLPDNVDSNCKAYILSGFIKVMERIHWSKTEPLYYRTLLRTLDLLSKMTQETYPYHIENVTSNDMLYGSEPEFIQTIDEYASKICQELLVVLKLLGDAKETKKQHNLALELFWRVIVRADIEQAPMVSLAGNLWMLSLKEQDSNSKLAKAVLLFLETGKRPSSQKLLEKLSNSTLC